MQTTTLASRLDAAPARPAPSQSPSTTPSRVIPRPPPMARAAVRAAAALAPATAARALARRFLTPRRVHLEEHERDLVAAARWIELPFEVRRPGPGEAPGRVRAYAWGGQGPTVLLVHGWSSAAGQLAAFVEPLRRLRFRVVAFDAPAHGASGGARSSAFEMAEVVAAAGRVLGPLHAVVAHSAGAAAVARAMSRGLEAGRVALLAPWTRPQIWVERFAAAFGLSGPMTARLVGAVEAEAGGRLRDVDFAALAPAVATPALVVHDRDDALVQIAEVRAAAAAMPAGRLVETRGLGHSRILRAGEVVEQVVRFVAGPTGSSADPSSHPGRTRMGSTLVG